MAGRRVRRPALVTLVLVVVFVGLAVLRAAPSVAATCTNSWSNPAGGAWNNLNNWSAGHVPTSTDDACITLSGTYTVTLGVTGGSESTTVNSLTIGGTAGTQALVIHGINGTGDTILTATTGVTNNANGSIMLDCQTAAMPCSGGGEFLLVPSGTLSNSGLITTSGRGSTVHLQGNVTNGGGTLQINDSAVYEKVGAGSPVTLTNQGTLALADGATLSSAQTVTNGSGGAINATGSGILSTSGTFNEGAGTTSGAPVQLTGGGTLNFTGAGNSSFAMNRGGSFGLSGNLAAGQTLLIHGVNGTGDSIVTAASGFTNAGSILLDCQSAAMPCSGGGEFLLVSSGTLNNSGLITTSGRGSTVHLQGNVSNNGGTIQVNDQAVFELVTGSSSPVALSNQGTIALADGAQLTTDQTVTNGSGGAINASGSGVLSTSGTFNEGAGITSGGPVRLTGGGTLNFTGAGNSSFVMTVLNQATSNQFGLSGSLAAGQSLLIHGVNGKGDPVVTAAAGFTNAGSIVLDCQTVAMPCSGGGEFLLVSSGTLSNSGLITTSGRGSTVHLQGNLTNADGTIQINDSATFGPGTATLSQTGGTTTVTSGANLDVSGSAGPMSLAGGTLNGMGKVTGSVSNGGGTVAPGTSPGTLTITGNYSQGAGGTLDLDVTGTSAGQFDVLNVSGNVMLGGTLALLPSAGYAASATPGDSVTFLPYGGSRTGTFATTTVNPPLAEEKPFTALYNDASKRVDAVVGLPPAPSNTALPAITGTTTQGQTLSTSNGSWTRNPTAFSYQWQDCDLSGGSCSNVTSGGTSTTYTLTAGEVGHTMRVIVTATNAGGSSPATSAPTAAILPPVPSNTALPAITGTTTQGQTLSTSNGSWTGNPTAFSYQWQRCTPTCANIAGATSRSYALTAADVDARLRVLVTARNSAGSAQAGSSQVGPVAPAPAQIKAQLLTQLSPSGKGAKIATLLKKGGYTLSFKALSAGRVVIDWYYVPKGAKVSTLKPKPVLVATGKASFSKASLVKLTIKLTQSGKQMLKRAKSLKLTSKGTYTPAGKAAVVATKTITLKR
jgi:hypothetical protein